MEVRHALGDGGSTVFVDPYQLDDVDERLLSLLQENGRYTATDLAERIGVSDNTIHNRMRRLEEADVITGYTATIDHKRTEFSLYFLFTCTVRISRRAEMAEEALAIPRVLEVTELMTGERNLLIKVVGAEDVDISRIAERLEELDIEVNDEDLIRAEHAVPLDYVQLREIVSEE